MSKLGAAFLTGVVFATTPMMAPPSTAAEAPHRIARDAAWGCRDKHDVFHLLFLGMSTSFDSKLAQALSDGSCVFFKPGENVRVEEVFFPGRHRPQISCPGYFFHPMRRHRRKACSPLRQRPGRAASYQWRLNVR